MSVSAFGFWALGMFRIKAVDIEADAVGEKVVAGVGDWDLVLLGVRVFVAV